MATPVRKISGSGADGPAYSKLTAPPKQTTSGLSRRSSMRFKSCVTFAVVILALLGPAPAVKAGAPRTLQLTAPAFAETAHAESAAAGSFLDFEAGLAAYFNASIPINIQGNQLRNVFRTIETDAPNYIIGSVPLAGYSQSNDVRVFVHASGWVVAYYPRSEPASKVL